MVVRFFSIVFSISVLLFFFCHLFHSMVLKLFFNIFILFRTYVRFVCTFMLLVNCLKSSRFLNLITFVAIAFLLLNSLQFSILLFFSYSSSASSLLMTASSYSLSHQDTGFLFFLFLLLFKECLSCWCLILLFIWLSSFLGSLCLLFVAFSSHFSSVQLIICIFLFRFFPYILVYLFFLLTISLYTSQSVFPLISYLSSYYIFLFILVSKIIGKWSEPQVSFT